MIEITYSKQNKRLLTLNCHFDLLLLGRWGREKVDWALLSTNLNFGAGYVCTIINPQLEAIQFGEM